MDLMDWMIIFYFTIKVITELIETIKK